MEDSLKIENVAIFTVLGMFVIELLRGGSAGDILLRTLTNLFIFFILYFILMPLFKKK